MIKYLGSKRLLLEQILDGVSVAKGARTVLDLFSGTSRVGHSLKRAGYQVLANDHNAYAHTLATCYVVADEERFEKRAAKLLRELAHTKPRHGAFTETYCVESRFFQPQNGARIEGIRDRMESMDLEPTLKAVALTSLMEAADRVDSTTGVQMAFLKSWAARSNNELELRVPNLLPQAANGLGEAHCLDAQSACYELAADVAYIDPPYNQHKYLGNYHIWETLVRWDDPETYGTARKRTDVRTRGSAFNSKRQFENAFSALIASVQAKWLVVSFNNEGYLSHEALLRILGGRGPVASSTHAFKRYVGAQIGIHNPKGERVGKVSHLTNKEFLFVVGPCEPALQPSPRVAIGGGS